MDEMNQPDGPNRESRRQPVYVLGAVRMDYGSRQRQEAVEKVIAQSLYDSRRLLDFLDQEPGGPDAIVWTLTQNSLPVYILMPEPAFARDAYRKFMSVFLAQLDQGVELAAFPGVTSGEGRLMSGVVLPVLIPDLAGIEIFATDDMMLRVLGPPPREPGLEQTVYDQKMARLNHFLETVFYNLQNPGTEPKDRALNFAATHAFRLKEVFEKAQGERLVLKDIEARRRNSPPGRDLWELRLIYCREEAAVRLAEAVRVFILTVDVATERPVTVGDIAMHYQ
jgi:PatG C-terminal/PatG Domain